MKYLSISLLGLAFITSCGPSQSEQDAAWNKFKDTHAQRQQELDEDTAGIILQTVALTQGEAAAKELLYCQQQGYRVTWDLKSGSKDVVLGWDPYYRVCPVSNRHKAQCDSIVKIVNRTMRQMAERKAAEEKRKDEAYDKAHKK